MEQGTVDLGIPGLTGAVEVARGGFSTIYRATQSAMERTVAVKLIHATVVDPVAGEHFLREVRATGRLSQHPNVAPVYDVGTTQSSQPYLIMPYYEHGSLQRHLDQRGAMSERDALRLARTLATTLDYVHSRGILHRDIKPANVLLTEADEPLLADFGVARLVDGSVPVHTTGANVVTWAYGPPEAFTGGEPTAAWDIYSLGATVYAMLTGNPPFVEGDNVNVFTVLNRIGNVEVPDLRDRGVSAPVAEAVRKTMAKDPADRPASAAEFASLLTRPLPPPRPTTAAALAAMVEPAVGPEPEPVLVERVVEAESVSPTAAPVVQPDVEPKPLAEPESIVDAEPEAVVEAVAPEPVIVEPVVEAVPEAVVETVVDPEPAAAGTPVEPVPQVRPVPVAAAASVPADPRPRLTGILIGLTLLTVVLAVSAVGRYLFEGYGSVFDGGIWEDVSVWAPIGGLVLGLPLLWRHRGVGCEWLIGAGAAFLLIDAIPVLYFAARTGNTLNGTTAAIWVASAAAGLAIVIVAWLGAWVEGPRIGVVIGILLVVGALLAVTGERDLASKVSAPAIGWFALALVAVLLVRAFAFPSRTTGAPALVVGGITGAFSALGAGGSTRFDEYFRTSVFTALAGAVLIAVVGVLRWRQSHSVPAADKPAA